MVVIASILSVSGQTIPSSFLPLLNARCSHIGTAKLFADHTVQGAPRWGAAGQPVLLLQVPPSGRWQKVLRGSAVTALLFSALPCRAPPPRSARTEQVFLGRFPAPSLLVAWGKNTTLSLSVKQFRNQVKKKDRV